MPQLVWLITGCTSGFGELFVTDVLSRGDKVIATGRSAETRLTHLKEKGAAILDLDVTLPPAEIDEIMKKAIAIYGHIDVLVNNAGYGELGLAEETTKEQYTSQIAVNLLGPIVVTNALLPHFRARKSGIIAFCNSYMSLCNQPLLTPYALTKHALAAYALGLHYEVSQFGISSVSFEIGHFRTPIVAKANTYYDAQRLPDYIPLMKIMKNLIPEMDGKQPGDPVKGVKLMVDVLKQDGQAKGRKLPYRMPIGKDAVEMSKLVAKERLEEVEEWEELAASTDFEEEHQGIWKVLDAQGLVRMADLKVG